MTDIIAQAKAGESLGVSERTVRATEATGKSAGSRVGDKRGEQGPTGKSAGSRDAALTPEQKEREEANDAKVKWHKGWEAIAKATQQLRPDVVIPRMNPAELPLIRGEIRAPTAPPKRAAEAVQDAPEPIPDPIPEPVQEKPKRSRKPKVATKECAGYKVLSIAPHEAPLSDFGTRKGTPDRVCKACSRAGKKAQAARRAAVQEMTPST